MVRSLALLLAVALPASGCASIIRGTRQDVRVEPPSSRAIVRVDGAIVTPGWIELRRKHRHRIEAEEPRYEPVVVLIDRKVSKGWLAADILLSIFAFPFGLAAPIVDFNSGAIYRLDPDRIELPEPGPE